MMTSAEDKPLPEVTDLTRPFWSGASQGRLMVQRCRACGSANFFPRALCVACGARALDWVETRPTGVVYAHTVASTVMMNLPGWKADLPVILCLVDLDEGPRLYAQLTSCAPEDVRIGMAVTAHFETLADGVGVPKFRPT